MLKKQSNWLCIVPLIISFILLQPSAETKDPRKPNTIALTQKRTNAYAASYTPKPPVWNIPTNPHLGPLLPPLEQTREKTPTLHHVNTIQAQQPFTPTRQLTLLVLPVLPSPSERLFSDAPLISTGFLIEALTKAWQKHSQKEAERIICINGLGWLDQLKVKGLFSDYQAWSQRFRDTRQLSLADLEMLRRDSQLSAVSQYLVTEVWTDTTQSTRPSTAHEWFLKITNDTLPKSLHYLLKMRVSLVNPSSGELHWQETAETTFISTQLTSLSQSGASTLDNQQALASASQRLCARLLPKLNRALYLR